MRKNSTDNLEKRESNSRNNENNKPYMNGVLNKSNMVNKSKK